METGVIGLLQECKRNAEIKTHITVMLLLLCFKWRNKNLSETVFHPIPTTM